MLQKPQHLHENFIRYFCSEEDKDDIDSLYDKLLKLVEPDEKEIKNNDDEFLFLGGKKKNKSRKNKESKLSKMNSNKKSKKNMKK